jgi:membrane protein YdbS with pleckstrin-like domain
VSDLIDSSIGTMSKRSIISLVSLIVVVIFWALLVASAIVLGKWHYDQTNNEKALIKTQCSNPNSVSTTNSTLAAFQLSVAREFDKQTKNVNDGTTSAGILAFIQFVFVFAWAFMIFSSWNKEQEQPWTDAIAQIFVATLILIVVGIYAGTTFNWNSQAYDRLRKNPFETNFLAADCSTVATKKHPEEALYVNALGDAMGLGGTYFIGTAIVLLVFIGLTVFDRHQARKKRNMPDSDSVEMERFEEAMRRRRERELQEQSGSPTQQVGSFVVNAQAFQSTPLAPTDSSSPNLQVAKIFQS